MTHPTTLSEALEMVPEYVMLRPKIDRWKNGDEELNLHTWEEIPEHRHNAEIARHHNYGRRRIPEEIRKGEAWWIMFYLLEQQIGRVTENDLVRAGLWDDFIKMTMNSEPPFRMWLLSQGD